MTLATKVIVFRIVAMDSIALLAMINCSATQLREDSSVIVNRCYSIETWIEVNSGILI